MSVAAYHAEVFRIWRDVSAVMAKHKVWKQPERGDEFAAALEAALGTPETGSPKTRAAALTATRDADVRTRIDAVHAWLAQFVNASFNGAFTENWTRASCGLRDSLSALEPFASEAAQSPPVVSQASNGPSGSMMARYEFARPMREKDEPVAWETIVKLWNKQHDDDVDVSTFAKGYKRTSDKLKSVPQCP